MVHGYVGRWVCTGEAGGVATAYPGVKLGLQFRRLINHICLVDTSILINWTKPFPTVGVSGVPFFIFILFRIDIPVSKQ